MAKFKTPTAPRRFEVYDVAGTLIATGERAHSNPQKMAKSLMNKYPGAVKVKVMGWSTNTRTFVK